jgi:hypothetical protein
MSKNCITARLQKTIPFQHNYHLPQLFSSNTKQEHVFLVHKGIFPCCLLTVTQHTLECHNVPVLNDKDIYRV